MSEIVTKTVPQKASDVGRQLKALFEQAEEVKIQSQGKVREGKPLKVVVDYKGVHYDLEVRQKIQESVPLIKKEFRTPPSDEFPSVDEKNPGGEVIYWRKLEDVPEGKAQMGFKNRDGKVVTLTGRAPQYQILPDGTRQELVLIATKEVSAKLPDQFVPISMTRQFKTENTVMIWAVKPQAIKDAYALAKALEADQKAIYIQPWITQGGRNFGVYWGFMYPQFHEDGRFVFVVHLTTALATDHTHWMDVKAAMTAPIEDTEKPKAQKVLIPSALSKIKEGA